MEPMTNEEFDKIILECDPTECNHPRIVKLYSGVANTDYGCTKCGMCHTDRHFFSKHRKDYSK